MATNRIAELVRSNPEVLEEGKARMEGVLARSATDSEFRAQLLTAPRAALSQHFGQELPESFNVQFIENTADATVVLPEWVDPSAELSESELEAVAGGTEMFAAGIIVGAMIVGIIVEASK